MKRYLLPVLLLAQVVRAANPSFADLTNGNNAILASVTNVPFQSTWLAVVTGDSLSGPPNLGKWPDWIFGPSNVIGGFGISVTNFAVAGYTLQNLDADYPTTVHLTSPAVTGRPAILFVFIGLNDFSTTNFTGGWQLDYSNYVYTARFVDRYSAVIGFTVYGILPTQLNATWQTNQFLANNYIRALPWLDRVVDTALYFPNWNDTTLFDSDGEHLNRTNGGGAYQLAQDVATVLQTPANRELGSLLSRSGTNWMISDPVTGYPMIFANQSLISVSNKTTFRSSDPLATNSVEIDGDSTKGGGLWLRPKTSGQGEGMWWYEISPSITNWGIMANKLTANSMSVWRSTKGGTNDFNATPTAMFYGQTLSINKANNGAFNLDVAGTVSITSTMSATNGYWVPTNALTSWPTVPRYYGDSFIANSNGVTYVLTSSPTDVSKWSKTNLWFTP